MKISNLIKHEDFGGYWLGSESSSQQLMHRIFTADIPDEYAVSAMVAFDENEDEDFEGYSYMVRQEEGVATVSVKGELVPKAAWYNEWLGMISYEEIMSALAAIVNEGSSTAVILDMSTPGGAVNGVAECAAFISDISTNYLPVYAHTSSRCHSGGTWLASATGKFSGADMSSVGSVGAVAVLQDLTEYFKRIGVSHEVIRSAENKMRPSGVEPITKKEIAIVQKDIDYVHQRFVDQVASGLNLDRSHVEMKIATGETFWAQEALTNGLLSRVESLDNLITRLSEG